MALEPPPDTIRLDAPAPDEAAAVAAAIERYLQAERRAAAAAAADVGWPGRAWGFAGRLRSPDASVRRIPDGTPRDPWTVAGRTDRL